MADLFRDSPAMLHSIDPDGRILDVSDTWLRKFGYSREEVVGRKSTEFLTEESQRYAREVVLPEFFQTGECDVEYQMVRKDGTSFPVRLRGVAIRNERGEVIRSSAALEDLTGQRELERRMRDAQKLESLGLMAGGIAHDFNNLLVSILGNAQIAMEEVRHLPDALASLTDIMTATRRAADLCRQLLAYSGKGRYQDELLNVSELVREIAQVLDVSVGRDALVKLELADGLHTVGDATQLRQVVMNLVLNAGEALEGNRGLVSISTTLRELDGEVIARSSNLAAAPGLYVCIEVSDTGCGIPTEHRDKVFDPFFTTKASGHGLGLAAVHGIVRAHQGTITLYTAEARGTSIKVFLPAAKETSDSVRRKQPTSSHTILVVDDEESVRNTLSRLLGRAGYQVVTAANGEEALLLTRARGQEFDAFLVDVSMPQMSGPQVFAEIRKLLPQAVVILMSGYNHVDTVREAFNNGLAGFLQKPFLLDSFTEILEVARGEQR
ncbi:MAG: response regulator [Polyangiaceae bacterium]